MNTPTPETDAPLRGNIKRQFEQMRERARRFERERDEALRAISKYACTGESPQQTIERIYKAACDHQTERDQLRKVAVELVEAVKLSQQVTHFENRKCDFVKISDEKNRKALANYSELPHVKAKGQP